MAGKESPRRVRAQLRANVCASHVEHSSRKKAELRGVLAECSRIYLRDPLKDCRTRRRGDRIRRPDEAPTTAV